jgi:hypothetical protein
MPLKEAIAMFAAEAVPPDLRVASRPAAEKRRHAA